MTATTAVAEPLTTLEPMKQVVSNSRGLRDDPALPAPDLPALAGGTGYFSIGMDSPVSMAWLTNKSLAVSSRTSAGIMSPAERQTMSPGTRVEIGVSWGLVIPARSTAVVACTIAFSSSAA